MKLYELGRGDWFRIIDKEPTVPPSHIELREGDIFRFHYIDGMYSRCTDKKGMTVHPSAWTEVEKI